MVIIVKKRVPKAYGTFGEVETKNFDKFMKILRDKGALNPLKYIEAGISEGVVLQIGHGPGYTGLEWLKHTIDTKLIALDVSSEMIEIAKKNLKEYEGIENRIEYVNCSADDMKIKSDSVDGVFCNAELHEWPDPVAVFNEINRVLKPGGKYYITAHDRAISPITLILEKMIFLRNMPKDMAQEYKAVISAAYTYPEVKEILKKTDLKKYELIKEKAAMRIIGEK